MKNVLQESIVIDFDPDASLGVLILAFGTNMCRVGETR